MFVFVQAPKRYQNNGTLRLFYMQNAFQVKNGHFSSVCGFIFKFSCTTVESYARLDVEMGTSFFSYDAETTNTTYQVEGTGYLYSSSSNCCWCSLQRVPRSYCFTKNVTPLESSHGHHLPARAASARAAPGSCLDLKRAATALRNRACSTSRGIVPALC